MIVSVQTFPLLRKNQEKRVVSRAGGTSVHRLDKWQLFCDLLSLFVILLCLAFQICTSFFVSRLNTLVRVVKNLLKTNFYEARIFTKGIKLFQVVHIFLSLYKLGFLKPGHWSCFSLYFFFSGTGYSSCPGYRYDSSAFLFSLVNKPGWAPVKLPAYRNYGSAIYDCSSSGPAFGGGCDILIADHASSGSGSYTYLGSTYTPPSGYSYGSTFTYTFLQGQSNTYHFTPDEVEMFYETT